MTRVAASNEGVNETQPVISILFGGHQEGAWGWARWNGRVGAGGQGARPIITMDGDTLAWRFGGFTKEGES